MDEEVINSDDLLGDAPGLDAVQIDALTQLSPTHAMEMEEQECEKNNTAREMETASGTISPNAKNQEDKDKPAISVYSRKASGALKKRYP